MLFAIKNPSSLIINKEGISMTHFMALIFETLIYDNLRFRPTKIDEWLRREMMGVVTNIE
jgi:hypothetical protein